jgi:two-component system OmpR family response regulator
VTAGRLLLVDDEEDIRRAARLSLERLGGWEVMTAGSAEEAVTAAHTGPVDAVLLDVMMPGEDGPATLERLRPVVGPGVPVVFLTARVQPGDVERLLALGAAGVIAKPFDPTELPAELDRVLGRD